MRFVTRNRVCHPKFQIQKFGHHHRAEMSNLAEKIAKLREFGLGEKSDSELHHLLRRAGFNLDGAINQFFEDEKEVFFF